MRISGTQIRHTTDHRDIILMAFERRQSFGQSNFTEFACRLWVERLFREAKTTAKKHHSLGRRRLGRRGHREGF